jgi:hypothetical protein
MELAMRVARVAGARSGSTPDEKRSCRAGRRIPRRLLRAARPGAERGGTDARTRVATGSLTIVIVR